MKKVLKWFGKLLLALVGLATAAFGAIQAVYWLNLDNKVMFLLSIILKKRCDSLPRDRRF